MDLEAIEAFEALLDEQEEQQQRREQEEEKDNDEKRRRLRACGTTDPFRSSYNILDDDDDDHDDDHEEEEDTVQTFRVALSDCVGKRIDAVLAELLKPQDYSRSFCGQLIEQGRVSLRVVSSVAAKDAAEEVVAPVVVVDRKSFKVEVDDDNGADDDTTTAELIVSFPPPEKFGPGEIVAQDIPLDVVYEDEHLIVINKAANMVVHPAVGNWNGTVVNALAHYYLSSSESNAITSGGGSGDSVFHNTTTASGGGNLDDSLRPGIVHRLDKGTTGLLVVAKTSRALTSLSAQFKARKVEKTYLAVCVGNPAGGGGGGSGGGGGGGAYSDGGGNDDDARVMTIDKPIGRHPVHRQRMRVVPRATFDNSNNNNAVGGRRAVSHVQTLATSSNSKLSLVKVRIETGRTHQIRVHLSDRRTPVLGDDVYGNRDWNAKLLPLKKRRQEYPEQQRPLLHAYELQLAHPATNEVMRFTAPVPSDMRSVVRRNIMILASPPTTATMVQGQPSANDKILQEIFGD